MSPHAQTEIEHMENGVSYRWSVIAVCGLMAALGSAIPVAAQTLSGQAVAIQTRLVGPLGSATTALADTGAIAGPEDDREASAPTGSVSSVVGGNTLHATTISGSDQVNSETSLADLTVSVAGANIGADFVMCRASAKLGFAGDGTVNIEGLSINGLPVTVTGLPNQTIAIAGGRLVINERIVSSTGTVVNALHVVTAVADVVVASAAAGVQ
jgi:hypothetical protein